MTHSSCNETWAPLRALAAHRDTTGEAAPEGLDRAIARAAEFLLRHRVLESERTGQLADPSFELLRWPAYWHYGLLPGLRALADARRAADRRASGARLRLVARRAADGRWGPAGRWWRRPGTGGANVELVDWGREGEARLLTLPALEILAPA